MSYFKYAVTMHILLTLCYTPEIPEPAPSLSLHGAQFGAFGFSPVIKITVICKVRMLPTCTAV